MRFFEICKFIFMNKCIFTIAGNTIREITRQAIFYLIVSGGCLLIMLSFSFTMFAFGEEVGMIKEMGVSTITICCLCLASLSATNAIFGEIEKGTIMTLLSKPVDKRSILLGKFLGIMGVVSFAFMMMGVLLTISLCVKDSLEYQTGFLASFASVGYPTLIQLVISFLQVAIMCGVAIAGSIYLPMVSNLSCCMFIYVIGNLINFFKCLFFGSEGGLPWYVSFFYVFFPNLEGFSTISIVNNFGAVSLGYMLLLVVYAILYLLLVLLITCEFFEKRECC